MKKRFFVLLLSTFLISSVISAQSVTLRQIGTENFLFNIQGATVMNGIFYYVDFNGTVNKLELANGFSMRLANTTYRKATYIFPLNAKLYILEYDGSLNEVNPLNGEWKLISGLTVWDKIERIAVVRNTLYTVENGVLYRHRGVNIDDRQQVGEAQFYNVGYLIDLGFSLYSLFQDGSFYEINTTDGEWRKITKSKALKSLVSADIVSDKLYSVNLSGDFAETLLSDGTHKVLDNSQFKKTRYLFVEAGKLYVLMTDGNLYEVVFS